MSEANWVTVMDAGNQPTAEMTAARLKSAGIPVVVIPGPASAYMGAGSASLVKVPESRVADARRLLQPEG